MREYRRQGAPKWLTGLGKNPDFAFVLVQGNNPDIDKLSTPEDVWSGGGTYPGFPIGAANETLSLVSTSASDTGTVTITGLKSVESVEEDVETITLNGLTPVTTTSTWYRVRQGIYQSSTGNVNAGNISCNYSTTTSTIFFNILAGDGRSYEGVMTVPKDKYGLLLNTSLSVQITTGSSDYATARLYMIPYGGSPVFTTKNFNNTYSQGGVDLVVPSRLEPLTDMASRVVAVSANNLSASFWAEYLISPKEI